MHTLPYLLVTECGYAKEKSVVEHIPIQTECIDYPYIETKAESGYSVFRHSIEPVLWIGSVCFRPLPVNIHQTSTPPFENTKISINQKLSIGVVDPDLQH